jgi:hypothetical protein
MEFQKGELVVYSEIGLRKSFRSWSDVSIEKRPLKVLKIRQCNKNSRLILLDTLQNEIIKRPYLASDFRLATTEEVKKYQLYTMYQKPIKVTSYEGEEQREAEKIVKMNKLKRILKSRYL